VDETIAIRTLENMGPEAAKRCLAAPTLWLGGEFCDPRSGVG